MKTIIFIVMIMLMPTHAFYLNYILKATNKGMIWRSDLSKEDKRAAATSLASSAVFVTILLFSLIYSAFFSI